MIRKFVEFAVKKPVLNHLFLAFFVIMAIFAYAHIPKEVFPPAQRDKIVIKGSYIGASAEVLDKMAVDVLEDRLSSVSDLIEITSTITNGMFTIKANIKSGANRIKVLSDVKDAIVKAKVDFPSDMREPTAQIVEQTIPLVQVAIAGDVPVKKLIDYGNELKDELSKIEALSKVTMYGDADVELVFTINSAKIKALGLNRDQVVSALAASSSIFPVGRVLQQGKHLYLSTQNGKKDLKKIQNMILVIGGKRVRARDVADISFKLSDVMQLSHFNGKRNVAINISKSKEGNALTLVKDIRRILKKHEAKHAGIKYDVYSDTSVYIKNRLNTVVSNIFFGLILLFVAMLLTMNRGIAFVVALGIPVSFIVGLVSADYLGYSLNLLSLLGALLALGMLVDEAIVVAENIYRHLEMGKERLDAVIDGTVEMFPAVLAATLTTIFAFLPLLLMSGDMGVFMRILPIMISILLLSSLFEAFYFLPLHAKDFIKVRHKEARSHAFWDRLYHGYARLLDMLFKRKKLALLLIVVSIFIFIKLTGGLLKFQLFPDFDVTQMYVSGKVNINNDIEDTEKLVSQIEKVLLEKFDMKNEIEHVTTVVGMRMDAKNQAEVGDYFFHIFIDLYEKKPENFFDRFVNPYLSPAYDGSKQKRSRNAKEIVADAKNWLNELKNSRINGKKVFEEFEIVAPQAGVVAHDLEIGLTGANDKTLIQAIALLKEALGKIKHVYNLSDDATPGEMELKLNINAYGQALGFNEQMLANTLRSLYLKGDYAKMFDKTGMLNIKIQAQDKDYIASLNRLELQVPGSKEQVALRDIVDFNYKSSFAKIVKDESERIRSVFGSFDKSKIKSAEIMKALVPTFKKIKALGVKVVIKGEEKENRKVQREMGVSAVIAIFLIFMTLVWMFDSFSLSLMVLSTIPLSILGVFVGHLVMGLPLTMPGLMGVVGLSGVVVNDGLIMIDFIRKAQSIEELIKYAKMRLRPILLTSLTTVLGLSTLIFFASGQSLILQPMAVSLGFGVAWATVLNLIYIPILYAVVKKVKYQDELKNLKPDLAKPGTLTRILRNIKGT